MASQAPTDAPPAEAPIVLTPPAPVAAIAPARAAGLVPVSDKAASELDARAETFVTDLVALDAASPEFGRKVDELTALGAKQIAEAAGQTNRFLDKPVRAMDKDTGIGADLTALRQTIEDLDPAKRGKLTSRKQDLRADPVRRRQIARLFRQLQVGAEPHLDDPRAAEGRQGRAADRQCRGRRRARQPVGADGQARADGPRLEDARRQARGQGERARLYRSGQGQGDPRDGAVLRPPADDRPADPDGGQRAGLSRARPRQEEQRRADQGRRPRQRRRPSPRCAPPSPSRRR